ncbi:isopentenyl-diphosphate Delta-isomerase [Candidatus Parcubacteria bacterium]|nr:isopentenyl-diphosphate Delta-isomerase [Candidatus Parcubacteria bacterium]
MKEEIILVDKNDQEIGSGEKMKVHQNGKLHRAFSIFVFNSKNEMLLQERAKTKYHCGGLWTNTCCSHPRRGELLEEATHRRLQEEMGFDCELKKIGSFIYKAEFDNGLTEHEYDHVFTGKFDGEPKLNLEEADDYKWIGMEKLKKEIKKNPESFTAWFKIAMEKVF